MEFLRKKMKELNIDCLLIPTCDFNLSEYVNDYFKAREYYSSFTGSAGSLVITLKDAYLFTDGRYFIQAERELKKGIKLMRQGIDTPLLEFLKQFKTIGADLRVIPANYEFNFIHCDFIFENFKRKDIVYSDFIYLDDLVSGENYLSKISKVREHIKKSNAKYYITTKLDEIAYLLNIRGWDIKYSMLNYGYLIISLDEVILFTDKSVNLDIITLPINSFYDYLKNLDGLVILQRDSINLLAYSLIKNKINKESIVNYLKALKNETEINNTKKALLKDSSIMIKFIDYVKNNYLSLSELTARDYLDNLRLSESDIYDLSFTTISAFNKSAAQLHYNGMDDLKLSDGFLLVDSGAQYKYGTTDITRTILLGSVDDEFKKYYTIALKALINLSKTKFRLGTTGGELDFISRSILFNNLLDYRCGTGHGVGYISNVHEGPNTFSYHKTVKIEESMITTIEPGVYIKDLLGIRHENMVVCKKLLDNEYGTFLYHETMTFIPFEVEAIDKSLLNNEEIEWLNNYHEECFNKLKDLVDINLLNKYCKKI